MFIKQILKLKGFPINRAISELETIMKYSPEELSDWQSQKKDEIVQFHIANNQYYRTFIKTYVKWGDLPILTKSDFQVPIKQIISSNYKLNNLHIGNTSGSSGHPFFYAKDKYCHALTWANIMTLYKKHDISIESKQARFYGIPKDLKGYYTEKVKDFLTNRVRFPVFDLGDATLNNWVERFNLTSFDYLYGYTSAMVCFARHCIDKKIILKNICPTLKCCIVTSEVCSEQDKNILELGFGVQVINEYGASEADVISFTYPNGDWRISSSNLYIEIIDENGHILPHGKEGRIIITSLFNKAMPLIRYEIGDLGVIDISEEGFPILKKLIGRVNDMVILPSGKRAAGLTFYYISRSILERGGVLKEFVIRQTQLDTFVFDIVSTSPLTKDQILEIENQMKIYLEPGLKLIVNQVNQIIRSNSGKIKHFYSELK